MPTLSRPARFLLTAGAALILLATIFIPFSVSRVPAGSIGLSGHRGHGPGWFVRAPFSPVLIVPLSGGPLRFDLDRSTREGATIRTRLTLDYRIDPDLFAQRAIDAIATGFEEYIRTTMQDALHPFAPSTLLAPAAPAGGGGRTAAPRNALDAIEHALRAGGIVPERLEGWVGPISAFSNPIDGAGTEGGRGEIELGPMPEVVPTGARLVLIGLDGADWDVIDPLIRAGRMPRLAALIRSGTRGRMRSYLPMISPLLWTTMVTGVGPDRHRIADFQAVDLASGRTIPMSSRFREMKALWNILGDAGLSTGFVAWWASYPAERVSGVQVSNLVAFETLRPRPADKPFARGIVFPSDYLEGPRDDLITASDLSFEEARRIMRIERSEFEAAVEDVLRPPGVEDEAINRKMSQNPVPLVLSILTGSRNYATLAADLLARRFDLTAVYFEGIDMMGHRFQHCMPPRMALCPDEDFERFSESVSAFHARQDALIGSIVDAAGDDATILIVSDHGFRSGTGRPRAVLPFTTQQPVEWHDEEGIFLMRGPIARRGATLASPATLFDVAPTVLHLLGLPVSEDMSGRVLVEALEPGFIRSHPVRTVPSYEELGSPLAIMGPGDEQASAAEDELLANLRALGYIGGDSDPDAPDDAALRAGASDRAVGSGGLGTLAFYHRNLAIYLLQRRDYARGIDELIAANERTPLPRSYQLLSQAYLSLGRTDEAIAALHAGLNQFAAMDPESVLWLVRIHLRDPGDLHAARDEGRRWAERTAGHPGLDDVIAGLLAEEEGDHGRAETLFRASLEADPTRVVAADHLYRLLAKRGAPIELEAVLRRGLARDIRIDEYHSMLGVILAETGRLEDALVSLRRAVKLDPYSSRFTGNLGNVLARLERWSEAADAYGQAAQLEPSAEIYMRLGSVYRRMQDSDRALAAFRQARDLDQGGVAPFLGIALLMAETGRDEEALDAAREGLDRHPNDRSLRSFYEDLIRKRRTPEAAPGQSGSG